MAENKPTLSTIYGELVDAVSGLGKPIFLGRPKTTSSEVREFIVIDLPTELRQTIKGGTGISESCYGTYTIFVKAKSDGTMNVNAQSALTQSVLDAFPINKPHVTAANPTVLTQGGDGYGYFVTVITFKIKARYNNS